MNTLAEAIKELIVAAKKSHFWCDDDNFYSCPKSEGGCDDPRYADGNKCNCGADEHNARVEELADFIRSEINK